MIKQFGRSRIIIVLLAALAGALAMNLTVDQYPAAWAQETDQTDMTPAGICGRTQKVQEAILAKIPNVSACADVTADHLSAVSGTLVLSDMGVATLKSGDFDGLTGLTQLKLNDNQIVSIPKDIFEGLTSINWLELNLNKLTALPVDLFDGLNNLTTLKLHHNELTALPEDVFDGLSGLKHLFVSQNQIAALPEDVFEDLTNLEELTFRGNPLTALPEDVFDGLNKLRVLNLIENKLSTLPEEVFDGLDNLAYLFLGRNVITGLPEDLFDGLDKLHFLDLFENQISTLPEDVFDGLGSLTILSLFGNRITALPADVFDGLASLWTLSLSNNQISTLPDGIFEGLGELDELNLSGNPGAPFSFTAELEESGTGFVVKVPQGAPRDAQVSLTGYFGQLSTDSVTIPTGSVSSDVITLTPDEGRLKARVSISSASLPGSGFLSGINTKLQVGPSLTMNFPLQPTPKTLNSPLQPTPKTLNSPLQQSPKTLNSRSVAQPPLTVSMMNEPDSHDGSTPFTFELKFSEEVKLSYSTLEDDAFDETGGSVDRAQRLDPPSNIRWLITFDPDGNDDVTILLPSTTNCAADGAICTEDGRMLSYGQGILVPGPNSAVANSPATGAPTIDGTAQAGQTLTAVTSGIADADGLSNVSYAYQWIRNDGAVDTDIDGQTGSTYLVSNGDVGKTIKVRVSFSDDANHSETLTSAATATVVAAANNPATGAPTIEGTAQAGQTLTAVTSGIADSDGLTNVSYTYQWLADDAEILGQTGSTYEPSNVDVGKTIKVRVTFSDDANHSESLTSAATATVTSRPDPLTVSLENAPASHDGSSQFTFDLRFSEEFALSYVTLKDYAFSETGGTVNNAQRLDAPSNIRWRITVTPTGAGNTTIVLPITMLCTADGSICTEDGRKLSSPLALTVSGPGN